MKARSVLVILPGIFLAVSAAIAAAGGMGWSSAPQHAKPAEKMADASPPIMVPNDYLEYLENEEGLETGSLTAPGVHPTTSSKSGQEKAWAEAKPPVMVSNDFLEYLEFERGIETGSLTAPGVQPTEISGPSEPVEIPEGG